MTELLAQLDETITLMGEDENHWRPRLVKVRKLVAKGKLEGVEQLMFMYGGMGSLNDDVNGDAKLAKLVNTMYGLAKKIGQDHESN